jgi:hypothetical protein
MSDDLSLFEMAPTWAEHWTDMPEFVQPENREHDSITVYFRTEDDRKAFMALVGADPHRQRGIWFPMKERRAYTEERTVTLEPGRYPIYVISKGRADTRLTSKALEQLGLPYRIVVEPQEVEAYTAHIDRAKILTLPFSNLGEGSIPARNFCWEHSISEGHRRHWILDDNLRNFARLNRNENRKVVNENPFVPCEEFVDRYTNVALAGMQYRGFASDKDALPPYRLNTRIYSCILIDNRLPFRWRGRYNEDTDLSLRALKAGYCTVLFNAYLIDKAATMTMTGGNTDELYADDGRMQMAESLREQHPDCVAVTEKWGRPQHHVDYSMFKGNRLVRVEEVPPEPMPEADENGQIPLSMRLPIR